MSKESLHGCGFYCLKVLGLKPKWYQASVTVGCTVKCVMSENIRSGVCDQCVMKRSNVISDDVYQK